MTLRTRLTWLVLAGAAVPVLGGGCKGGGASGDDKGRAEPVSSVASSAEPAPHEMMDAETFRATMRRGAHAEKTDRAQAAEVYSETLARTDLTKEQRATAQVRLGRVRLAQGKRDEARGLAQQALVLRPGWADAQALLEKIDAPAGAASGDGAEQRKAARAKKDGDAASPKKARSDGETAAAKAKAAEEAKRSDAEVAKAKKSGVAGISDADAAKAKEKQAAVSAKSSESDAAAAARKKHRSDLADRLRALEIERDLLRSRMKELESQLAALRKDADTKR